MTDELLKEVMRLQVIKKKMNARYLQNSYRRSIRTLMTGCAQS